MSNKYFALVFSDLHLGEEDSIFMFADPEKGIHKEYVEVLKSYLLQKLNSSDIRYLILLGDVMDLSLARRHQAFPAFKTFLEIFKELIGETLIYVPGNHDHHIWVALQEEAQIFQKIRHNRPPEPYYYALCPRIDSNGIHIPGYSIKTPYGKETFLYSLLPESAQKEGRGFLVVYPNLYISTSQVSSLLTHGHFFEEAWTLLTDLFRRSLREMGLIRLSVKKLEQINSPFIEFGWYSLGQAGELSKLLEKIWDELHRGKIGPLTDLLLDDLFSYLDEKISFKSSSNSRAKGIFSEIKELFSEVKAKFAEPASDLGLRLLRELIEHLLTHLLFSEKGKKPGSSLRHHTRILSEEKTQKRIQQYLDMTFPAFPESNTLIFGHTHVPFIEGKLDVDTPGGKRKFLCFNTGGWITDVYEAYHLSTAKPLVLAISEGHIDPIEIPWPGYEEFEALLEDLEGKEEREVKRRVKELIWRKLFN